MVTARFSTTGPVRGLLAGVKNWPAASAAFMAGPKKDHDAYRFLANNYQPGDEILSVCFSRGAYTARSLAGDSTRGDY